MSFSGRIRLYLVLIALLPPALIMAVVYFHSLSQARDTEKTLAQEALYKFSRFDQRRRGGMLADVKTIANDGSLHRAVRLLAAGRDRQVNIRPHLVTLDFIEIVDSSYRVLATGHRPGLLGERLRTDRKLPAPDTIACFETVEYDIDGAHAAVANIVPLPDNTYLYAGHYLDRDYLTMLTEVTGADADICFPTDDRPMYVDMKPRQLYLQSDSLLTVLAGGPETGFFLIAHFPPGAARPVFTSLLKVTGAVAVASVVLAILIGVYVTSQAKREIDNLVDATSRVAEGDFNTPVMAYQEGEFSQLADSFSQMMVRLKSVQHKLVTTEKIAAWQAVGRKLAHEIKNPLTPISISIDDLRRSHQEGLADFDQVLVQTTSTIKSEINRLTDLLDSFVKFARMTPPTIVSVRLKSIAELIQTLYRSQVDNNRLAVACAGRLESIEVDPDQIQQVLINLIKNGLETAPDSRVTVEISETSDNVNITVADNGPGFPDEILKAGFQPHLSKKSGGSGLGLVVCQRIIHDHGGTIELHNGKDGGAVVRIKLPLTHG